jgi:Domain of unknown function (DUF4326)
VPERVRVQGDLFHGRVPVGTVYVGRAAPGLPASPYANPFKARVPVKRDSDLWPYAARILPPGATRGLSSVTLLRAGDVVAAFSWWIIEQPGLMLRMADELGGRDLACWCPLPPAGICHADDLLSLVAELAAA